MWRKSKIKVPALYWSSFFALRLLSILWEEKKKVSYKVSNKVLILYSATIHLQ
jgi:hypothetical protein